MTAALVDFKFLFEPLEHLDHWVEGFFNGAPLLVALAIALVLGLRHASDPDHLSRSPRSSPWTAATFAGPPASGRGGGQGTPGRCS